MTGMRPDPADTALTAAVNLTMRTLTDVTRIDIRRGPAYETHPPANVDVDTLPLAVIDNPADIDDLLTALDAADLTARTVVPALPGLSLLLFGPAGDFLTSIGLLTPRWIRHGSWPNDALLPHPVPDALLEHLDLDWEQPTRTATAALDGPRLTQAWADRWPGTRPIAHQLPRGERWIRFHSLPGSRRYADSDADYTELLARHTTVLRDLAGDPAGPVLVITCSWSAGPTPPPRSAPVTRACPDAEHWQSIPTSDPGDPDTWTHVHVTRTTLDDPGLIDLLLLAADDATSDVIIAAEDLTWLYHPYDGGADVHTSRPGRREVLRDRYRRWLPTNPAGL